MNMTQRIDDVEHCSFQAAISEEQMMQMEANADYGVSRRIMLAVLTKDSEQLRSAFTTSPDAMLEALEMIVAFKSHIDDVKSLAESAIARLALAGQAVHGAEQAEAA